MLAAIPLIILYFLAFYLRTLRLKCIVTRLFCMSVPNMAAKWLASASYSGGLRLPAIQTQIFRDFPQFLQATAVKVPQIYATAAFFQIHYSNHSITRRCTVWATGSVVSHKHVWVWNLVSVSSKGNDTDRRYLKQGNLLRKILKLRHRN
jgi:hypothetical protein